MKTAKDNSKERVRAYRDRLKTDEARYNSSKIIDAARKFIKRQEPLKAREKEVKWWNETIRKLKYRQVMRLEKRLEKQNDLSDSSSILSAIHKGCSETIKKNGPAVDDMPGPSEPSMPS